MSYLNVVSLTIAAILCPANKDIQLVFHRYLYLGSWHQTRCSEATLLQKSLEHI